MVRLGPGMDPQQIANTLSEFGTLGLLPGDEARRTLEAAVMRVGPDMTSQDVANMVCTYAKLLRMPGKGVGRLPRGCPQVDRELTPSVGFP